MGNLVITLTYKPKKCFSLEKGINNLFKSHIPEKIRMYFLYKNLINNMRLKVKNNSLYYNDFFEIGYKMEGKVENIETFSIHD